MKSIENIQMHTSRWYQPTVSHLGSSEHLSGTRETLLGDLGLQKELGLIVFYYFR